MHDVDPGGLPEQLSREVADSAGPDEP